jgi:SAM-dependent methyltransferase
MYDDALDPFCGSGALLVGAKERGAAVIGCDIAPAAIRRAGTKLGLGQPAVTTRRPSRATPRPASGGTRTAAARHG